MKTSTKTSLVPFSTASLAMQWNDILIKMIESRGNQWGITALVKAELYAYGLKAADMSKDEMRDAVNAAIMFLESVDMGPCKRTDSGTVVLDNSGRRTPLTGKELAPLRGSCINSLTGEAAKRAATTKAKLTLVDTDTPFDGPVSGTVPRDPVDNTPVNVAPVGDGVQALNAMSLADASKVADALALAAKLRLSKNADVLKLVAFVEEFFA